MLEILKAIIQGHVSVGFGGKKVSAQERWYVTKTPGDVTDVAHN